MYCQSTCQIFPVVGVGSFNGSYYPITVGSIFYSGGTQTSFTSFLPTMSDGLWVMADYHDNYLFFFVSNHQIAYYTTIPISVNSSITMSSPISETYLNNPITFAGSYTNANTFNAIKYQITDTSIGLSLLISTSTIPLGNGIYNWSNQITLPYSGNYTAQVSLYDTVNATSTDWSAPVSFSLASTTIHYGDTTTYSGNSTTSTSTYIGFLGTQICSSIFDVGCNVENVFIVLFQPSTASIQNFTNLGTIIQNKPPFGYFNMLETDMNNINASGTSIFNITIPYFIQVNIFTPIQTALAWIVWYVALIWLYRRLKNIQL